VHNRCFWPKNAGRCAHGEGFAPGGSITQCHRLSFETSEPLRPENSSFNFSWLILIIPVHLLETVVSRFQALLQL
jgi:hypothetical protein